MANPAPAKFLFPNPWNLCAKSCRQGPLCDIHHIKGEKSNLWGPWHEENKESALFLPLFCCPGAMDARAGLWAPRLQVCAPGSCWFLPWLALSLGTLWVVEQIWAVPHKCALGVWSRCCLALAGRVWVKSYVRGISFEVFSSCSQSLLCCRILRLPPSAAGQQIIANYLFLI